MNAATLKVKLKALEREAELLGYSVDLKKLSKNVRAGQLSKLPPISRESPETSRDSPFTVGSERSAASPSNSIFERSSPLTTDRSKSFAPINHFAIASQGVPQISPVDSSFSSPKPVLFKSIRRETNAGNSDIFDRKNDEKKAFFSTGCSKNAGLPLVFKELTKGKLSNDYL